MAQGAEGSIASASPQTSVYIGNLKRDVDKEALAQMAAKLGRVANFRLHAPSGPGHDPDSPATAVVEYSSAEEAARAASHVHGRLILGQPVRAWVAAPGAAAHPLPAGTGSPQTAPKAVAAAGAGGGGAVSASAAGVAAAAVVAAAAAAAAGGRAAYPGGAEHMSAEPNHDRKGAGGGPAYARYPPLSVPLSRVSSHEDPRNPRPSAPARGPGPPDGHEDPRGAHPRAAAAWERGPLPQNQRVAERSPPQAEFAEDYPPPPPPSQQQLQQQQLQRQQSWPAGRPRGENGAGAAAPPPPPPRYVDEDEPDPYGPGLRQRQPPQQQLHQQHQQQQRQWYRRESHDEGEDPAWEQPGRDHYPPPRRAAVAAVAGRPEHPSEYLQYGPPSSRWHDEVDPHAGGPRAGYVVDGAGGQRRLPSRGSPRGGPPRGYADMPPHELRGEGSYDDGDLDEDVPGGKRRRPLAPPLARSTSRGGGAPAGGRGAWEEDTGYALPPAPSIRGEDFEKEVVKAAALLVAEREMRAREAARKEEKRGWPEEADPSRQYDDRKVVPRAHGAPAVHGAPAHGAAVQGGAPMRGSAEGHRRGSVEGRRRPLSSEGVERRGQRNTDSRDRVERDSRSGGRGRGGSGGSGGRGSSGRGSSGRGGSGGAADRGSWKDGAAEDAWSGSKRPRGDGSPAGRGGGGRGEDRKISKGRGEGKGEGRRTSDELRSADEPKAKPTRRAESRERHLAEGRDRHRDDSKGKYRDETRAKPNGRPPAGSGDKDKERHPPSLRVSQPGTEWERNGKRSDFQAEDGRRPWQSGEGGGARDGGFGGDSSSRGDTGYFVHVGGISFSTTFTTLAKRFAAFGDVNGFKVIFNNVTCRSADISAAAGDGADRSKRHDRRHEGKGGAKEEASKAAVVTASTGFAFISFEDERGMDKAIAGMNDQTLDGHVLKVSRGRMPGKFSVQHYRPYPELASPSNFSGSRGPANKWSAPKGRSEYEPYQPYQKQHHQPNLNHYRPPERGDRRPAPVSPAASAAAASIVAAAATSSSSALASSRRSGGGGAAATGAAAADKAKESGRRDDAPNGKRARHSGPRERKLGDGPGAADQRDGGSGSGGRTIKTEKDSGGGGGGDGGDSRESGKSSAKVKKEIQETARSPATSARSTRTEKRPTIRMTSGLTRPNS